jgi:hypothetical protein
VAYGRPITKRDKAERNVGKVAVLGAGYQMGGAAMARQMLQKGVEFSCTQAEAMGVDWQDYAHRRAEELSVVVASGMSRDDIAAHYAVSQRLIDVYREQNQDIVKFWARGEELIAAMCRGDIVKFGPGEVFETRHNAVLLPSGRMLQYKGLRAAVEEDKWGRLRTQYSYMGGAVGKEVKSLYGGKLTENLVQAFCRDIVAVQAVELRWRHGYKIVTTTHDEIVIVTPQAKAEEARRNMVEVMSLTPSWCRGMPVNAEAHSGDNYGQC